MAAKVPSENILLEAKSPLQASIHHFGPDTTLSEGQILVHVEKFVLTANSLTYAVGGNSPPAYFKHFPVPAEVPDASKYRRSPVWGSGIVRASRCQGVAEGTRIFGFFPMSPTVIMSPVKVRSTTFVDGTPARAKLMELYTTYRTSEDPFYKGLTTDEQDFQMADGSLFSTGWAASQCAVMDPAAPELMLVTSASSRTAYAAGFSSKFHKDNIKVIGLTSASNVQFTKGLGFYDEVYSYEDVQAIDRLKVTIYDFAGNVSLLQAIYKHFGDKVASCHLVGFTHVTGLLTDLKSLGSPAPAFWTVWDGMQSLWKQQGRDPINQALAAAQAAFKKQMFPFFRAVRQHGADHVLDTWNATRRGEVLPGRVYVMSMWPKDTFKANDVPRSRL